MLYSSYVPPDGCSFSCINRDIIYLDTASQTSDNEEQFDAKSDEISTVTSEHPTHQPPVLTSDYPDLALPNELHHDLNLDLRSLDDPPVDMLSPISETTEPGGSLGNSLNNSMSSTHDQQEFLHQEHKNLRGGMDINLTPPKAQTPRPRKSNSQSCAKENLIPRGSYVITDVNHTLESAFAAGIPVVERASVNSRGSASTSQSSDGALLYRSGGLSGGLTNGIHEQSNDARDSSNITQCMPMTSNSTNFGNKRNLPSVSEPSNINDQQYSSGHIAREQPNVTDQRHLEQGGAHEQLTYIDQRLKSGRSEHSLRENFRDESGIAEERLPAINHWSERRNDNRFSTFTKSKNHNGSDKAFGSKETGYSKLTDGEQRTFAETEDSMRNEGPSITWLGEAKKEERSVDEGRRLESGVRKTNWGEMASEVNESSDGIEKGNVILLYRLGSVVRKVDNAYIHRIVIFFIMNCRKNT